jgi:hypothetical protein
MVETENLMVARGLATEFEVAIPTERLRERIGTAVAASHHASEPPVGRSFSEAAREFFASFRPLAYASIVAALVIAGAVVFLSLKKESASPSVPEIARDNNSGGGPGAIATPTAEPPSERTVSSVKDEQRVVRFKPKRRTRQPEPDAQSISWQQRQYDYAIARLDEALKIQPAMSTAAQVEYAYNVALIDSAIASGREAARRNPRDPQATQSMLAAYQSKVDLMNQVANARPSEQ